MQAFYSDQFVLPLPAGHRFPMAKYAMLRDAVAHHLPAVQLLQAPRASDTELMRVHTPAYVEAIADGTVAAAVMREIGFPWSEAMAERARRSVGATVAAARSALRSGIGASLAGGTHHAYADKGGGFCVFNDVAVAARVLQAQRAREGRSLQVAVIDLDVHQGNGTARIFQGDNSVFTLSLHGEKNFPFRKEAGDIDVGLPDGCGDADYLAALDLALRHLDERCSPDLVFFLAGADPFEGDRLGRLKLTPSGMQMRDQRVFDWCFARQIPVVLLMAGGYGLRIEETVALQLESFRLAWAFGKKFKDIHRSAEVHRAPVNNPQSDN